MKIFRKNIALIMLFVMIGNFFIAPIYDVYAESSSEVENYISTIEEDINSINNSISIAKLGVDYISDDAYIYAVDKLEGEVNDIILNYNIQKNIVENGLSLEKLLIDSNSKYLDDYYNYFTSDVIISLSNIDDIKYNDGVVDKLILGEEIATYIKDTYFKDSFYKLNDININYHIYISNYVELYDSSNTQEEVVDEVKKVVVLEKQNTKRIMLLAEEEDSLTTLISEINDLKTEYSLFETELLGLYNSNELDYTNLDSTLVNGLDSVVIDSFVSLYEKGINLDEKYQLLMNKVNTYLEVNEEDVNLTSALELLDSYYNKLSKDNMLFMYSDVVNLANLTIEDIVEELLSFGYLDNNSEEYNILMKAKYAFYPVSLKDSSLYQIEVKDNYLFVSTMDVIEKTSFNENIQYREGCNFKLNGENINIDNNNTLELYDKNNNLLRTLNFVIKNDINNDGVVDSKDLEELKNKVLKDEITDLDLLISDINNDGIVNSVDLVLLDNLINGKDSQSNTTEALYDVVVTENDNNIIYQVYLKTNGIVRGFEFSLVNSTNLKIVSITPAEGVVYENNNSNIKVIGLGNYLNDTLLIEITYEKLNSGIDSEFVIDKGIITFDNDAFVQNERVLNVIKGIPEEVTEEIVVQTVNVVDKKERRVVSDTNNTVEEEVQLEEKDEDVKKESIISGDELEEEDVLWGNIIKIALIVLLGALIIYFLNKDSEEEEKEFFKEDKNIDKKDNIEKQDNIKQEDTKKETKTKHNETKNNHTKKKKHNKK